VRVERGKGERYEICVRLGEREIKTEEERGKGTF